MTAELLVKVIEFIVIYKNKKLQVKYKFALGNIIVYTSLFIVDIADKAKSTVIYRDGYNIVKKLYFRYRV